MPKKNDDLGHKAYVFRIYPNAEQKILLAEYSAQDEHPWPAGLSSSVVQIEHLRC